MTRTILLRLVAALGTVLAVSMPAVAQQPQRPNMIVIMGDDVGWAYISVYNQGIMAGRTPNLDKLAAEGMRFTDYYAEASCTAGRANFITGELPIRTGLTTVGQAGSPTGIPDEAPTIATVLKSMGYATGQFGKNHLGDLNQFLPTVHGFDEFFGYLYHLDAMEDPCHPNYPPELKATVGPRNMVHSWATDRDDPTVQPRWGKIGKQRIEDAGELCPKRMETVDDEILSNALAFIDKARRENKPFFVWLNPTRMHVVTHLSEKYEKMRTPQNGWSVEEAGMAQLDDIVGAVMQKVKDLGIDNDTIIGFTTDNGAENFTWPDGGQTPFAGGKGTVLEGGFRVPMILHCLARCRRARWRTRSCRASTGSPRSWRLPGTRTSWKSSRRASSSGTAPIRSISTATTKLTCSPARVRRSVTRFFTSPKRRSVRCASTTSSIGSSISRTARLAAQSRRTGRSWSICVSIPMSARA